MPRKKVGFVDSTLRDGQEALLRGRLRTELVTPILESLDEVGFQAIEGWGGGTFRASLALLHEDPWERLRILKEGLKRTPVQMLLRGRFLVGDRPYSYGFVKRFLSRAAELGVEIVRLLDPLNNFESLRKVAQLATRIGLTVQVSVLCSNTKNNLDDYRSLINSANLLDADAVGIFDPWGTLQPLTVGKLVELLVKMGTKRVFVHLHNLGGAAILSSAVAREKGVSIVDSCFGAFANDGSLPPIEVLVGTIDEESLIGLSLAALVETSDAFQKLRNEYFDRVPAIMLPQTKLEKNIQEMRPAFSSILRQEISAKPQNPENAVRREVAKVMDELGLAALVAPVSEIVARQVFLNIHSKDRYSQLTDEFLALLRGKFGPLKVSSRFKDGLRIDLNQETEGLSEKGEDLVEKPTSRGNLGESDSLSFVMFPQEFSEMSAARDSVLNKRERIVAATLAIQAEDDRTQRSLGRLAVQPKAFANPTPWRYPSRFEDSHLLLKRGFIEEPF